VKVQTAIFTPYGPSIVVALVDSHFTVSGAGDQLLDRLAKHFPRDPIMLVSVEQNGFRAYATFQTGVLLALLQLELLSLEELDLDQPPIEAEAPLPF
jgi:hypothetical protein